MKNLFLTAVLFAAQLAFAGADSDYVQKMNAEFAQATNLRERGSDSDMRPSTFRVAADYLQARGIPIFDEVINLPDATNVYDVIVQEYLRQRDWGLPWLPISFHLRHLNAESQFYSISQKLEAKLQTLSKNSNQQDLFKGFLFNSSIYHSNQDDFINVLRALAEEIVAKGEREFYPIRVEIHQEPSTKTLADVDRYLARPSFQVESLRPKMVEMRAMLAALFGQGTVTTFMKQYTLDPQLRAVLNQRSAGFVEQLQNRDARTRRAAITKSVSYLEGLEDQAVKTAKTLFTNEGAGCRGDMSINCNFEKLDLISLLHQEAFVVSNEVMRATETGITVNVRDVLSLSRSLFGISAARGLISMTTYEKIVKQLSAVGSNIDVIALQEILRDFERYCIEGKNDIKRFLATDLARYEVFVPQAGSRMIDDLMLGSTLAPLGKLLGISVLAASMIDGKSRLEIGDKAVQAASRVLNPGISKGKLLIPDEKDIVQDNFPWNKDAIYVLKKTPSEIHKVAGIITADSGTVISHVNILANNLGISNLYVSRSAIDNYLAAFKGQEILLMTLPNGEAKIKLWDKATAAEKQVYHEYNKVKIAQRVRLDRPDKLDQATPMLLSETRNTDRGRLVGGKATGQGELGQLFKGMVPEGIVLPFGSYYQHVTRKTKSGTTIYDQIQSALKDPRIQEFNFRQKAFGEIRQLIQRLPVEPTLRKYLAEKLSQAPFAGAGLFVRSDTNAEDLPQFVGAGLNETIPNIYGVENVIEAVKTVWSSPFTEKAYSWRADIIDNPWDVFPSVVIQIGIPSTVAGVMVVGDPRGESDEDDLVYVAANEGLGVTIVNGEATSEESTFSRKGRKLERVRAAVASTRAVFKTAADGGGIAKDKLLGLDPLLTEADVLALADIGDIFQKHMKSKYNVQTRWDLEWGVVHNMVGNHTEHRIWLFQARPFNGNKVVRNTGVLKTLESPNNDNRPVSVPLDAEIMSLGKVK